MLLTRPGELWLMLYCSGSLMRSILRYGEPGGYSVTTTPPGRRAVGAYGASVVGPGFGTSRGAGSGGRAARGALCAQTNAASAAKSKANPNAFFFITFTQDCIVMFGCPQASGSAFAGRSRLPQTRYLLRSP